MALGILFIFVLSTFKNIRGDDTKQVQPFQPMFVKLKSDKMLHRHVRDLGSCEKCGEVNLENSSDITDGKEVEPPFKYPWMAAIQVGRKKICAGAILSEEYILTAAHCLINNSTEGKREDKVDEEFEKMEFWRPEEISIGFMTHTTFVHKSPPVLEIIQHSGFNLSDTNGVKHDICLLKLKEKIKCSKFMNPICLPPSCATIPDGQRLEVSGWDLQECESGDPVTPLKESEIKKVKFEECESLFHPDLKNHYECLEKSQKQGTCHMDAGSPMSFRRKGKHYLLGVASMFASDRCRNGEPFIFTSVPEHMTWIEDKTGLSPEKCKDFKEE